MSKIIAKNAYCSWCGHPFAPEQAWPRQCASCEKFSYINPFPVAVALVPVGDGLLVVRRGIEPRKGQLALPGGFIDVGERWQEACVREVFEESQVELDADLVQDFTVLSAPDGTVLIFGITQPLQPEDLPPFVPNDEVSERAILTASEAATCDLAFPLHTEAVRRFFARS